MKKLFKPLLAIILGFTLFGIGYSVNGNTIVSDLHSQSKSSDFFENIFKSNTLKENKKGEKNMNSYEEKLELVTDITDFSLCSDYAKIEINSSSNNDFMVYSIKNIDPKNLSVQKINGEIRIEHKEPKKKIRKSWFSFFNYKKEPEPEIKIKFPQNFQFKNFRLYDIGICSLDMREINIDNFIVHTGVGNITGEKLLIKKSASITTGVGNLNIKDSEINNLSLESGVGNSIFTKTKILGKSNINGGVGNIKLFINENIDNYTIEAESGIGNVSINNEKINNFFNKRTKIQNENTNNVITVKGGVGNIELKFNQN